MSGIYISGMEMPKRGHTVTLTIMGGGEAVIQYYDCKPQLTVPILYKAVPVPPHGRLIDADALAKMCQEMQSIEWNSKAAPYSWAYAYESFEGDIDNAPTIIEAEEVEA